MQPSFNELIKNISLTENQEQDARTKYNGVCETLHDIYYPDTAYNGSTKYLSGSYGKATNIRPPRDVDVIFKMPPEEFDRFNGLSGNKQSTLLQEIRSVLQDKYTTTEKIRAFGKVVVVPFSEGTHAVELLPAWEMADGKYRIPNTENGGSWEIFDPAAAVTHIRESNKLGGKTLSLIRICKKWAEHCSVPMKSFVIELLVVEYLASLNATSRQIDFASLVTGLLKFILGKKNTTILTATYESIALGEEWVTRAESAMQRASKAQEYEQESKFTKASEEWQKLFGYDFPRKEDAPVSDSLSKQIADYGSQYPSAAEEFLDHTYGIPFKIDRSHKVEIDAQIDQDGFRRGWLSSFIERRLPIKKRKKLLFTIRVNTVEEPYEIWWKVRNFGDEAQRAKGLRGEIREDNGYEQKEENTLYYGQHYIECYVVAGGACVAVGRILVPIGHDYD